MAVAYGREHDLTVEDYVSVISRTAMRDRRPLANATRLRAMLDGANFVVTARGTDGKLLGLARCISDEAWICYCAELAVREDCQGQGIGKKLIETCTELLGPGISLTLNADPEAVRFYERIGMTSYASFYIPRTDPA